MSISDEKYVALTTYKRSGEGRTVPVWIAELGDGTVGFTTASSSWKVKRIRNDGRVVLQPSDSKGKPKPGTDQVQGTAVVVDGADFERVEARIKAKYGIQFTMITLVGAAAKLIRRGSGTDVAVVITPSTTS